MLTVQGATDEESVLASPADMTVVWPELAQLGPVVLAPGAVTRGFLRDANFADNVTHDTLREWHSPAFQGQNLGRKQPIPAMVVLLKWYTHTCQNWVSQLVHDSSLQMFDLFCTASQNEQDYKILGIRPNEKGWQNVQAVQDLRKAHLWGTQLSEQQQEWIMTGEYLRFDPEAGDSVRALDKLASNSAYPFGAGGLFAVMMQCAQHWGGGVGNVLFLPWRLDAVKERTAKHHAEDNLKRWVLMLKDNDTVDFVPWVGTKAMATLLVAVEAGMISGTLAEYDKKLCNEGHARQARNGDKAGIVRRMKTLQKYLNEYSNILHFMYVNIVTANMQEANGLLHALQMAEGTSDQVEVPSKHRRQSPAAKNGKDEGCSAKTARDAMNAQQSRNGKAQGSSAKAARDAIDAQQSPAALKRSFAKTARDASNAKKSKNGKDKECTGKQGEESEKIICPGCFEVLEDPKMHPHHCQGCGQQCHSIVGCDGMVQDPGGKEGRGVCLSCLAGRKASAPPRSDGRGNNDSQQDEEDGCDSQMTVADRVEETEGSQVLGRAPPAASGVSGVSSANTRLRGSSLTPSRQQYPCAAFGKKGCTHDKEIAAQTQCIACSMMFHEDCRHDVMQVKGTETVLVIVTWMVY